MYCLGVVSEYRGRGIATRLVEEAFQVAKKANCGSTSVYATSPISKRIFEKLGMTLINTLPTSEYLDKKTGNPVFPEVKEFTAFFMLIQ